MLRLVGTGGMPKLLTSIRCPCAVNDCKALVMVTVLGKRERVRGQMMTSWSRTRPRHTIRFLRLAGFQSQYFFGDLCYYFQQLSAVLVPDCESYSLCSELRRVHDPNFIGSGQCEHTGHAGCALYRSDPTSCEVILTSHSGTYRQSLYR